MFFFFSFVFFFHCLFIITFRYNASPIFSIVYVFVLLMFIHVDSYFDRFFITHSYIMHLRFSTKLYSSHFSRLFPETCKPEGNTAGGMALFYYIPTMSLFIESKADNFITGENTYFLYIVE